VLSSGGFCTRTIGEGGVEPQFIEIWDSSHHLLSINAAKIAFLRQTGTAETQIYFDGGNFVAVDRTVEEVKELIRGVYVLANSTVSN
jgi:hypothetical protein